MSVDDLLIVFLLMILHRTALPGRVAGSVK